MPHVLIRAWRAWEGAMKKFGNIVSAVILGVFYFTVFALFALPFRFVSDALGRKEKGFRAYPGAKDALALEDFEKEF